MLSIVDVDTSREEKNRDICLHGNFELKFLTRNAYSSKTWTSIPCLEPEGHQLCKIMTEHPSGPKQKKYTFQNKNT